HGIPLYDDPLFSAFIHSTTEVLTTLSPAAFVENEGISTELVIILIVSLNDHASTNLGRPGVTKDVDSLQNDEAVAREYQSEEDGISANAKRNKDNEQTRVKKQVGMQLGGTKPLDGEDEVTYTDTDQPGRSSTTLGSSSEKTLQTNQSTNQFPEYSCPLSNKNNPVSTHSNETGLAHSTMTEEQRRRDTNPPSDTSTVAQDTEDGFKQTENVLNGQTPFSNVIS
ncbi:hypothetical protein MAR_030870, partial [Mya arenaria]